MDNSGLPNVVQETSRRLLRTWADNAAAHARNLARIDRSWGTTVTKVADGWLILAGNGMYVNRAMGVGLDGELSSDDLDQIVALSSRAGVTPSIEVSAETDGAVLSQLKTRGLLPVGDGRDDFAAMVRPIPGPNVEGPDDLVIRSVRSADDLRLWQETAARGWGHTSPIGRKASDAFAAAAFEADEMMIAFEHSSMEPLGCASVTIRNGLATLGGMSTDPEHRRRGVQAALVSSRLNYAAKHSCDLAATTAATGGPSERNLRRHGFERLLTIQTWELTGL